MGYATLDDLANHMPAGARQAVTDAQAASALETASAEADGKLANQYELPLVPPYPRELVRHVCNMAVYELMVLVGYNTEAGANKWVRDRYDDAQKWFGDVGKGNVTPSGIQDSKPNVRLGGAVCSSSPRRGW